MWAGASRTRVQDPYTGENGVDTRRIEKPKMGFTTLLHGARVPVVMLPCWRTDNPSPWRQTGTDRRTRPPPPAPTTKSLPRPLLTIFPGYRKPLSVYARKVWRSGQTIHFDDPRPLLYCYFTDTHTHTHKASVFRCVALPSPGPASGRGCGRSCFFFFPSRRLGSTSNVFFYYLLWVLRIQIPLGLLSFLGK